MLVHQIVVVFFYVFTKDNPRKYGSSHLQKSCPGYLNCLNNVAKNLNRDFFLVFRISHSQFAHTCNFVVFRMPEEVFEPPRLELVPGQQ